MRIINFHSVCFGRIRRRKCRPRVYLTRSLIVFVHICNCICACVCVCATIHEMNMYS